MSLRPLQKPYPPLWYMRNPVTAAMEGMHTIIVGSLDGLAVAVPRYRAAWEEHQGAGALTAQGEAPMIGLVVHLVVADTDDEAISAAAPAWEKYRWNLAAPRRLEAEKRNLTQFMSTRDGSFGFVGDRPAGLPTRELRRDIDAELERFDQQTSRPHPNRLGGVALAGSPAAVRDYMDEYVATGANYFVCSFQWGDLSHAQAMRSIELFTADVMPRYARAYRRLEPVGLPVALEPRALLRRPRQSRLLRRARAPARILVAGAQECLPGGVDSTGAQRDAADRIPVDGARPRLGTAAVPFEHARGIFLPARGRRGRRALGGFEEPGRDDVAGGVDPQTARAQPRVVADEPDHAERERDARAGEQQQVDPPEGALVVLHAPHEHEEGDHAGDGEDDSQQVDAREQVVGGAEPSEPQIARGDPAEGDETGAEARPDEQRGRARASRQPRPEDDEQDAEGEQRRLALEDGAAGPEVRDAGPAEHEEDRADEHMHRTIMT